MSLEVTMPRLSDSMEEGTIIAWLKTTGDKVERGEPIVEIETDKATMSFEAETAGVLTVLAQEGETVPLGGPIAAISDAVVERPVAPDPQGRGGDAGPTSDGANSAPPPPVLSSAREGRPSASPLARRLAADLGVDLGGLTGTGPRGRIIKRDVLALPPAVQPAPPLAPLADESGARSAKGETTVVELSRLQQVIARRMAESKATAPDFALTLEAEMGAAVQFRDELKQSLGDSQAVPSFNDMIVKAAALALRDYPKANGSYRDGAFELHERVNVGIAVAAEAALIVPVIADADTKGLARIASEARLLAGRVRDGSISPPELAGGTFTVSNLGMFGITSFTAVINVPQAAILAVGALKSQPSVAADGTLEVRKMISLTLTCDHRILYGAEAAEFLGRIRENLERPLRLAL
jgi:pyruvate dehydrogenase E2 component (dihydrolipoamide acetyltransferase)